MSKGNSKGQIYSPYGGFELDRILIKAFSTLHLHFLHINVFWSSEFRYKICLKSGKGDIAATFLQGHTFLELFYKHMPTNKAMYQWEHNLNIKQYKRVFVILLGGPMNPCQV
ncbi:hypothetical protein ACJX0J_016158 [Zea mays]